MTTAKQFKYYDHIILLVLNKLTGQSDIKCDTCSVGEMIGNDIHFMATNSAKHLIIDGVEIKAI